MSQTESYLSMPNQPARYDFVRSIGCTVGLDAAPNLTGVKCDYCGESVLAITLNGGKRICGKAECRAEHERREP